MTLQTQLVLRALLEDPAGEHYGLEIAKSAGLASGSLYPILARLEQADLVESYWEDIDQSAAGRPRRRYYRLTQDGAVQARQVLAETFERLSAKRKLFGNGNPGVVAP
jgi:DNA-binding PadR family transcriptional regulator